ncbi:MAG: DUF2029 domain-containing protein [Candidatus Eremiobacteraeota bacterium]|nr:DUF2029 domain-containing protein [Candidatus Eremiobacteraeota bacterium]
MAVPAAMLAGAIGARVALARPPVKAWTDLAQPLPVVTAWGTLGLVPFAWLAFAVAAGACAIVSTWGRPAARGPSLRLTLACAALTLAAALAWPVVFSSDVYAYAAYGDAMLHGLDPYAAPAPTMHDAFFDAARWQWGGATFPACVYGPAFVALATLLTAASAGHVAIALWIFRLAACAAFLGSIVAFDRALQRNERRRLAVAAYALNPVALWSAAEGHNDAFVLLFVMTAFALMRSRTTIAGFALGFAAAFKAVALAVPGLVLFSRAEGSSAYRRFALATLGGVALAIAIALPVQVHALRGSGGAPSAPQF